MAWGKTLPRAAISEWMGRAASHDTRQENTARKNRTMRIRTRVRRSRTEGRPGAAVVECALVLPIMATLSMGIAEFGQALKISQILSQAAREGARLSIDADTTSAEVTTIVKGTVAASTGLNAADVKVNITVTRPDGSPAASNEVALASKDDVCRVEVNFPYASVQYVPTSFLGSSTLKGFAAMQQQ